MLSLTEESLRQDEHKERSGSLAGGSITALEFEFESVADRGGLGGLGALPRSESPIRQRPVQYLDRVR
jgi:hypothetical protein